MEEILTPEQVSQILQVHPFTVLKFIKKGKLKASKLGRVYRIRRSDVDKFLDEQAEQSGQSERAAEGEQAKSETPPLAGENQTSNKQLKSLKAKSDQKEIKKDVSIDSNLTSESKEATLPTKTDSSSKTRTAQPIPAEQEKTDGQKNSHRNDSDHYVIELKI